MAAPRGARCVPRRLALAALRRQAPATFGAFERALAPDASLDTLEALVDHVVG